MISNKSDANLEIVILKGQSSPNQRTIMTSWGTRSCFLDLANVGVSTKRRSPIASVLNISLVRALVTVMATYFSFTLV